MLKIEISISRDILHYILEKISSIESIDDIMVTTVESVKLKSINKFDTANIIKLEFIIEDNILDDLLHLLLTDPKINKGQINIFNIAKSFTLGKEKGYRLKLVLPAFIRAHRKDVYNFITNYNNLLEELPEYIRSIDIINKYDNVTIIEEEVSIEGILFKQLTKHILYPPAVHEVEILSGYLEGSRIIESYTEQGNNTDIIIICELIINPELESLLGAKLNESIENSIKKIINRISKILENKFKE
jgi:hypothetical protein